MSEAKLNSSDLFSGHYQPTGSEEAKLFLLDYTASSKWEDMEGMDWTTSEVHELLGKFIRENNEVGDASRLINKKTSA